MSRGLVWTPAQLAARGWKAPVSGQSPADALQKPQKGRRSGKQLARVSAPVPYERDVLRAVLAALQVHPRVAWAVRLNSGMAMMKGKAGKPQPVRFGFEGAPDVIGQMNGFDDASDTESSLHAWPGVFLAVECKRPGKNPTAAQQGFLDRVRAAGGVAFCAHGVEEVWLAIGKP